MTDAGLCEQKDKNFNTTSVYSQKIGDYVLSVCGKS